MRKQTGLTLLDLLVAITLLAIILTTIYWVFANHQRSVEAASEARDAYGQGRLILDRMVRDVTGAWLPAGKRPKAGFAYLFSGRETGLDFITTAHLSSDIAPGLDLVEVGYRIMKNEREDDFTLVRRQDSTPDDDAEDGGSEIILTKSLKAIEIGYLNRSGQELSEWEAEQLSELPYAVKISLTLTAASGKQETFSTVVALALAWPRVKFVKLPPGWEGLL